MVCSDSGRRKSIQTVEKDRLERELKNALFRAPISRALNEATFWPVLAVVVRVYGAVRPGHRVPGGSEKTWHAEHARSNPYRKANRLDMHQRVNQLSCVSANARIRGKPRWLRDPSPVCAHSSFYATLFSEAFPQERPLVSN